jgi:hypothetical protein
VTSRCSGATTSGIFSAGKARLVSSKMRDASGTVSAKLVPANKIAQTANSIRSLVGTDFALKFVGKCLVVMCYLAKLVLANFNTGLTLAKQTKPRKL